MYHAIYYSYFTQRDTTDEVEITETGRMYVHVSEILGRIEGSSSMRLLTDELIERSMAPKED